MKLKKNSFYDSRIVFKPWGYEYVVFRHKKMLSITLLNINSNKSTSLHCHPTKKTGFVLLDGRASIQLGLSKNEKKFFKSPSKLMIRTGLFHSIKCISKRPLIALEFETPVNKNDLVRFNDKYGREKKNYEKGNKITKKNFNLIKLKSFKKDQKYIFGKTQVILESHYNFKRIIKEKNNVIFAVINGNVSNKKNQKVLLPGDIIKTDTLKKLASKFKIKNKLNLLKISNER